MPVDAAGNPYTVGPNGQMFPTQPQGGSPLTQTAPTQAQAVGQPMGNSSLPKFAQGMTPDQAQALANQYLQAAGLPPDTGGQWAQYWQQFGQNDPNYFMTRLLNGAAQQGGNMSAFQDLQSPTAPGGWGPGTSGFSGGSAGGDSGGGGFSFDPSQVANDPGYKFALDQGLNAIQSSAAAKGTLLGTGTLKDLAGYAAGAAYGGENQLFNQNLNTFQTNFNNLGTLAGTGYKAATQQGDYTTQIGNANAQGSVNQGNIWGQAVGTAGDTLNNAYLNANLYKKFNPQPTGGAQ